MIVLQAPHEIVQTVTVLPSPKLGDSYRQQVKLNLRRSISNVVYTYVKSSSRQRLTFKLELTRMKSLELIEFINSYYASRIRLTDHSGQVWVGNIVNAPASFEAIGVCEVNDFTLEFEGVKFP